MAHFQRAKIRRVFDAMDGDGDGLLTKADFERLTERWVAIRPAADEERLRRVMMGWWETLRAAADTDADGRLTLDEVFAVARELPAAPGAVYETAEAMFDAVDEDGDGRISRLEYQKMIWAWTERSEHADAVFALLDGDGDGFLTRPRFTGLWYDFWATDDPAGAGAVLFGPVEPVP
ncbi:EF-hand domain-containing protein [Actinocorallia sp. API 0066]|uniref:EF-hand domain-containing protein n=1 Tax=Actinocorallia sp. API 0066 TaxID=2896846 RepID=UPI001E5A1BD8|nr:EF-hand domain-containing protein [Actinocorallia sp. API 0066]MCD0449851.1 EF-hand domain-containing protein [Actinocorallia sp. API 0066]